MDPKHPDQSRVAEHQARIAAANALDQLKAQTLAAITRADAEGLAVVLVDIPARTVAAKPSAESAATRHKARAP